MGNLPMRPLVQPQVIWSRGKRVVALAINNMRPHYPLHNHCDLEEGADWESSLQKTIIITTDITMLVQKQQSVSQREMEKYQSSCGWSSPTSQTT